MARDESGDVAPIYKASKKRKEAETREAKKGDIKKHGDLDSESDDPDQEYESVGTMRAPRGDPERMSDEDIDESGRALGRQIKKHQRALEGESGPPKKTWEYELDTKGGKGEYFRKRAKEVPTS